MSLFVDLATQDDGYRSAARRGSVDPPRRGSRLLVSVLLVATGVLLATAAVAARHPAPAAASQRTELVRQVRLRTAATDAMQRDLQGLRADVGRTRRQALDVTKEGAALDTETMALELATGALAVTGPGLQVTLADARANGDGLTGPAGSTAAVPGAGRVLDRDIQDVVNALWSAGAEAVAVGDQRLTVQSAIRSAGEAILVDFRPVAPPYVVTAVGEAGRLETDFAASPTARRFRSYATAYGLQFSVRRTGRVELPAASGLTLREARPAGSAP